MIQQFVKMPPAHQPPLFHLMVCKMDKAGVCELRASDAAKALGMSRDNVWRELIRLQAKGFVEKIGSRKYRVNPAGAMRR